MKIIDEPSKPDLFVDFIQLRILVVRIKGILVDEVRYRRSKGLSLDSDKLFEKLCILVDGAD